MGIARFNRSTSDVREGSIVMVRTCFGNGAPVRGKVLNVEEDIKNNQPGIDYLVPGSDHSNWAYLHQIDEIIKY